MSGFGGYYIPFSLAITRIVLECPLPARTITPEMAGVMTLRSDIGRNSAGALFYCSVHYQILRSQIEVKERLSTNKKRILAEVWRSYLC